MARIARDLLLVGVLVSLAFSVEASTAAEYAFHWDPADGGPKYAEEVCDLLKVDDAKPKVFEVRVFTVVRPAVLPQEIKVIARERKTSKGAVEATYKLRADVPMQILSPVSALTCPLTGASWTEELDVAWGLPAGSTAATPVPDPLPSTIAYSRTCSADEALTAVLPATYAPTPPKCASTVSRYKDKVPDRGLKVELWTLTNGGTLLEVSLKTEADSPEARDKFYKTVVVPLLAAKARPSARTKTELAGCP